MRFHSYIQRINNTHCSVHNSILDKCDRKGSCLFLLFSSPCTAELSEGAWYFTEDNNKKKTFFSRISLKSPLCLRFILYAGAPDRHTVWDETVLVPLCFSGKKPVLVSNVSIEVALLCCSMRAIGATIGLLPCVNSHVSTENGGFLSGVTAVWMLTHPHSILPQRWGVSLFLTVSCRGIPQGQLLPKRNSHILGPLC